MSNAIGHGKANYLSTESLALSTESVLRVAYPMCVGADSECEERRIRGPELLHKRLHESYAIDAATGCWNWTRGISASGYGRATFNYKQWVAHRLMVWALGWDVPNGMVTDHLCRNRRCVNPAHLEVVTKYENDMRGESAWAKNARKTHCLRGHEFTPENTGEQRGGRFCITCRRMTDKARHARNRASSEGEDAPRLRRSCPTTDGREAMR